MDVMKKKQMLATLVMLSLLQGSVYADEPFYDKENNIYYGNGTPITIKGESFTDNRTLIIGSGSETATGNITGGNITIDGGVAQDVMGGAGCGNAVISDNMVTVNGGDMVSIYGGYNFKQDSTQTSEVKNNKVIINYGINDGILSLEMLTGGAAQYGSVSDNCILIYKGNIDAPAIFGGLVGAEGSAFNNRVEVNGGVFSGSCEIYGAKAINGNANNNIVNINNGEITKVFGGSVQVYNDTKNAYDVAENGVVIKNAKVFSVIAGDFKDYTGMADAAKVHKNYVVVGAYGEVEGALIAGMSEDNADVINNKVILCEKSIVSGMVAAAFTNDTEAEISGNSINLLQKADVTGADLYGYKRKTNNTYNNTYNNNLVIDKGWTGKAKSVQNFNNINFNNIVWQPDNDKAILTTDKGSIKDTNINLTLQNGQKVNVGESMLLFKSNNNLGDIANDGSTFNTNLGVATAVEGIVEQSADNKTVKATIKDVKLADQTKLVAKNRAVAAAFVNQGTDLIADSLDTLSRDSKYGVKTFAAVHGNRSKYDVNSDIKINGWSTIVGVGAENEHNGGDFSWGVFYENGSGNYRTYNDFNNEFFRGDGSLVYNGGGIAARYENSHGVYTEGSLRAGMLKNEMTDALSDGENKYGYESETAYYGAHIGVGKIFSLGDDSDLDVYGKFFHTYTEGDSFNVADDEFEFDSINSDRLRIGARVTSNKENKFSTYYGLAYEYEFNGDAEMRAAGMKAPTQSLQGSSVMAEIGLNYQPTPDSPWSFDLNMRGYAGERQGGSFNVQATYTF